MRKIYILLITSVFALTACQQASYKISIHIDNAAQFENQKVYLAERINREFINFDSAKVAAGQVVFEGVADSTKVSYIIFTTIDGSRKYESFILENGSMYANLDADDFFTLRGTKQNEILADFYLLEHELEAAKESVTVENDTLESDSIAELLNQLDNQKLLQTYEYVSKHVNTPVGTHLFLTRFWLFDVEQKQALFEQMNSETKAVKRVGELIDATEREIKTSKGKEYTDFSITTPDGEMHTLSQYVGKSDYLLVDFWASWCGPCIRSFPELKAFYNSTSREQLNILGVSLDRNYGEWSEAIKKYELDWNHISELKYWDSEAAAIYAVNSIPSTILIDRNGVIVGRNLKVNEMQALLNQSVNRDGKEEIN